MTRVLLASSFPARQNLNLGILSQLRDGFASLLGEDDVALTAFETVAEQVRITSPDLVVLVGSSMPAACDYRALATEARRVGCRFVFWTVEDPYESDYNWRFADHADVIFTTDEWSARFYDRDDVHFLPTAASPDQMRPVGNFTARPIDIFFCGVGYRNRQRLVLDALPVLEAYRSVVIGENWPKEADSVVRHERIPSEMLPDYYGSAKLVLNLGRDHFLANERRALPSVTPGPRTFEAAMSGCVQIYHQPSYSISTCFTPGEEIIVTQTMADFKEKVRFLLTHSDEAISIAERAQQRCLRDHTYRQRAMEIMEKSGVAVVKSPATMSTGGKL